MKKNILQLALFTILFTYSIVTLSQNTSDTYQKIRLHIKSSEQIDELYQKGLAVDHIESNEEGTIDVIVNQFEKQIVDDLKLDYEILIEDVAKANESRLRTATKSQARAGACDLQNYNYGTMGSYHTVAEIEAEMDAMFAKYPSLVKEKYSIGKSFEGRDIYVIKISDNPDQNENTTEGTVYYDALTHAREPMSCEVLLYYMWWMLENYTTNEEAKYLIDNREMYFVLCVNPDGVEYNRSTNPNGGGLWRKNRNNTFGSCVGVDLNRNHETEGWGTGWTQACGSTYYGPSAASEPETKAIESFIEKIKPSIAFSNHCYTHLFISALGYRKDLIPQFDIHAEFASEFIPPKYRAYGNPFQTLGATGGGSTIDYFSGKGIIGWTPEIGNTGTFWPSPNDICPFNEEFIGSLKFIAWASGGFSCLQDYSIDGTIRPGASVGMTFRIKNKGLTKNSTNTTITLRSLYPKISILNNEVSLGTISPRSFKSSENSPINLEIDASATLGDLVSIVTTVKQDGVVSDIDTLRFVIGDTEILFEDNAEKGMENWTSIATATTQVSDTTSIDHYGGKHCFADTRDGNYKSGANGTIKLKNTIDLTGLEKPYFEFKGKWALELKKDFVYFEISTNNGATWNEIKSYTGNKHWNQERIDLSSYSGEVTFRFRIKTDSRTHSDGFYFDDIRIVNYFETPLQSASVQEVPSMTLYPNPAQKEVRIQGVQGKKNVLIQILNQQGTLLEEISLNGTNKVSIEQYSAGVYFMKLKVSDNELIKKFVIE